MSKQAKAKWKNLLKKGGHLVKCVAPIIFIYDWANDGLGPAVNGALWPLSEVWTDD